MATLARGAIVGRIGSAARSAVRAVGREVAEGFLEHRRELESGAREIASGVGDSVTAGAIARASGEAGSPPEEPREDPVRKIAREVGEATATGAVDGLRSRVGPWRLLVPFVAGVAATITVTRVLGAREPA